MLDPAWPPAGLIVGGTNNGQENPEIVEDGAGGAIIVWLDGRTGGVNPYDVYGQHVLASGVADPAWPTNGIALCSAAGNQSAPRVVSNGAGGAIVCWQDPRDGMHTKLYAQRVSALGTIDSPWPPDGLAVCAAPGHQVAPAQVPDGAGGAVVVWADLRGDTSAVYAARVLAAGTLDPAWPATGRLLCTAPNVEFTGAVVDGAGGAVAVWKDYRNDDGSFTNGDLFAQRVLSSGIVDPAWPLSATPLCIAPDQQLDVAAAPSGAGGVIAVWQDQRLGISFPDLYGQRVNGDGQLGDDAPVSVAPAVGSGFASLRISPSPARGLLHIDFTLARAGGTRLELLDVSGRRLMVRDFGWLDRGRHLIDLQTSLAPGVYVVRTGTGSETHEARAVLIR